VEGRGEVGAEVGDGVEDEIDFGEGMMGVPPLVDSP
jgi:hypothetical protein